MAFFIHSTDDGRVLPYEYLPAGAITPKIGMALKMSSGVLALCTGTSKPEYISMEDHSAALTSGTLLAVVKVQPDVVFETVFSASATDVLPGDAVTIASDALRVTSTESSGVATVVSKAGSASGDKVRVRFL